MKSEPGSPISLRGKPRRIEAMIPVEVEPASRRASLRSTSEKLAMTAQVRIFEITPRAVQLQASLPDSTPPGEYEMEMEWEDRVFPAHVTVEPYLRMQIVPRSFTVQVAPGSASEHELQLVNSGNVPIEIPKVHAFGVSSDNILGDSFAATYRAEAKHLDRVGQLADELAQRYGLVRLVVKGAPLTLQPGQLETVTAELKWPDKLEPGTTYSGTWPLGPASVGFTVEALGKAPTRRSPK